jgi:ATP-binding cassette subfamily B multidrug efflux pump
MEVLGKYIKRYASSFGGAIAFLAAEAMIDLLQPTLMAYLIDRGVVNKDINTIWKVGMLMFALTAVGAVMAIGRNFISSRVSQQVGADLRSDVYRKIQGLDMATLNQFETGSLLTRMTNDINQLQNFIHGIMRVFVKAPLIACGSLIMVIFLNPSMAWILILVIIGAFLVIYLSMTLGYKYFAAVQKSLDQLNIRLREYLSGIRVVKAFQKQTDEVRHFDGINHHLKLSTEKALRVMAVFSPLIALVVNLGIVAVLWFGSLQMEAGTLEIGKLMAMVNYMIQLLGAMVLIAMIFNILVRTKASGVRIKELMCLESHFEKTGDLALEKLENISFSNVSFGYSNEHWVCEDINFKIKAGERIAIIGATGSGKSTLLQLLLRFYEPQKGSIKINEQPLVHYQQQSIRQQIALVPQKSTLFSGSIHYNLKWANPEASEEMVLEVLKSVDLLSFVNKQPEGLETILGRGGVNLSGGQKQRMAIARALLTNPQVLILDDATSAVDVVTEQQIKRALDAWPNPLTVVMVVQRIAMAMGADKIIVMDDGKMVGFDPHEVLLENCQVYRELYDSQIGNGVSA